MSDSDEAWVPPGAGAERADEPNTRAIGRADRAFLRRAVAYMAGIQDLTGARGAQLQAAQISDGLPTSVTTAPRI